MRRGLLVAVLLGAAALAQVGPSGAFDALSFSRAAVTNVVADNSAYNGVAAAVCSGTTVTNSLQWCSFGTVTNKATIDQTYYLTEQEDANGRVSEWRIGGGTAVSSGRAATPGSLPVNSGMNLEARIIPCFLCPSNTQYTTYWTIEGEKPNRLNSIATTIQVTVRYT